MVGFSGLPAELIRINLVLGVTINSFANKAFFVKKNLTIDVSGCINRIQSGTALDQLLAINLNYLKVFCSPLPDMISFYQILVFKSSFRWFEKSQLLARMLKKSALGWLVGE